MKRIHIIISLSAAVLLSVASCTKFLDIKPYGKTIPETPEEFSALMHYHLEKFDEGEEIFWGCPDNAFDIEMVSDNPEASLTKYPAGNLLPLYAGSNINNKDIIYRDLYATIRDCNIVIGYINEDGTTLSRDVLGTAYALRGACYFRLLREFCEPCHNNLDGLGVPIVTEFDMEAKPVRSSIRETFQRIEADYKKAIEYNIQDEIYRFSNDALEALLARLYFWVGDYGNTLTYSRKVLERHPLVSGNEYIEMVQSEYVSKGEVIFKGCTLPSSSTRIGVSTANNSIKSRPVSRRFADLFPEKENDVRFSLSFNRKRECVKSRQMSIRSSELQLMIAEALYHTGDEVGALAAINELRAKRITGVVPYTMETLPAVNEAEYIKVDVTGKELTPLINAILNERRKELFCEGDRWYELKRNGRPEFWVARQGRKYTTEKFLYTWPIPINDMLLVPGLIQNPGYDKTE